MAKNLRPGQSHRAIAHDAGLSGLSIASVLAGVVTAYGTFAIVAAIVGSALRGSGVQTDFRTNDWTGSGAVAALASAVTLLVAYLCGGYVAGRMARRNATLHGVAVFLLSLVAGAVVGAVVGLVGNNDELRSNLQSIGVPTNMDQVSGVAITGAAISLAAILIGSLVGSLLGERWHTKLSRRVVDPDYGPEAQMRAEADQESDRRQARVQGDEVIRRDTAQDDNLDLRDQARRTEGVTAVPVRSDPGSDAVGDSGPEPRYTADEWRQIDSHRSV